MATLRIAVRNYEDFVNALTEEARAFESLRPGVRVELVTQGIHPLYDSAIRDGGLREGRYDLALLGTDWLAEGMASGALEDLALWHESTPIAGWPEEWPRSLVKPLVFGNKLSSLPWHDGPECLVYRTDMFGDAEKRVAFRAEFGRELEPPKTWDEFEETARFFTDAKAKLYGTVFAAFPDGHNTVYDFALQLWSRGGELVDAHGVPQFATPQAVEAIDFYRRVVRNPELCHPESPKLDSTQSGDLFLAGEVAMMANWFGFAARSCRESSPLAGKVAIAPIPTDGAHAAISLSVFWALAMGAGSVNKELAWEFLRFIATPECDLKRTRHGAVGVRLSTWRNAELRAQAPPYREIEAISLGARTLPTGPHMAEYAKIIDALLTRALTTDTASAALLEEAQQQAEQQGIVFP